jgi:hypothetical protein
VDEDSRSKLLNQLLDELEAQNAVNENDYVVIDDEEEEDDDEISTYSRMRMIKSTRAASTDEPIEVEEAPSSTTTQTNTTSSTTNTTSSNSNLGTIDVDYRVFLDDS